MRAVTIKQHQQMTKEIEEQLGNGRLNYLKVVNDYCYWMGWNRLCSMGRVMKGNVLFNVFKGQQYSHTRGNIRK